MELQERRKFDVNQENKKVSLIPMNMELYDMREDKIRKASERLASKQVNEKKLESNILSLAYSREFQVIFVGLENGKIVYFLDTARATSYNIWDREVIIKKREVARGHKGGVKCLKFRRIEKYDCLISGSIDHNIKIWRFNKKDGLNLMQTLVGHDGAVLDLEFNVENEFIVSIATDKTLRVWKQDLGRKILEYPWFLEGQVIKHNKECIPTLKDIYDSLKAQRMQNAHFSSVGFLNDQLDDLTLIACDLLGNVHLFKLNESTKDFYFFRSNLKVHTLMINKLFIATGDNTAFTTSYDQKIYAFDLDTGKDFFKTTNTNKSYFTDLYWNSTEQELIASDERGYLFFINIKGERGNFKKKVFDTRIVGFDYLEEDKIVVVASESEIKVSKVNKGFELQRLSGGHEGPVLGLNYLDFKQMYGKVVKAPSKLISIGLDNTIRTWDAVDQTQIASFDCPSSTEVLVMDYVSLFGLLVTGHENGELYLWDIDIGTKIRLDHRIKNLDNTICALAHMITTQFNYLFSAGYNGKIYVWEFTEKKSAVSETLVFPQLKMSFFANKTIEKENIIGEEILALACNDNRRHLYAGGNANKIFVIEIFKNATFKHIRTIDAHTDSINILILDEYLLFSASDDMTIKVWDCMSYHEISKLKHHRERINNMVHQDGMIVSTSIDSSIVFYNYKEDRVMFRLKKDKGKIMSIAYSGENKCLFLGSEEENILKINLMDFESMEKDNRNNDGYAMRKKRSSVLE